MSQGSTTLFRRERFVEAAQGEIRCWIWADEQKEYNRHMVHGTLTVFDHRLVFSEETVNQNEQRDRFKLSIACSQIEKAWVNLDRFSRCCLIIHTKHQMRFKFQGVSSLSSLTTLLRGIIVLEHCFDTGLSTNSMAESSPNISTPTNLSSRLRFGSTGRHLLIHALESKVNVQGVNLHDEGSTIRPLPEQNLYPKNHLEKNKSARLCNDSNDTWFLAILSVYDEMGRNESEK